MKKWKAEEWAGIVFLAAAFGMLLVSVRLCFADGIWYDELFTMGLTGRSFRDLTAFTARDVHPPLYYYYVKVVQGICRALHPGADVVVVSKICSILPLLGLGVYGLTKVRQHFGLLCAGLFLFGVTAMPNLPQYTVEIRMYTTAMFFVTAAFLHGYEIICGISGEEGKGAWKDWLLLAFYGIFAAYTHYFAGAAAGMVYLFLLVYLLAGKAGRGSLKSWLLCVLASVALYLPWMAVVIRQMAQVKENYWILPLTWRTFGSCVKFLMKPPFGGGGFQAAAAVVLFGIYAALWLWALVRCCKMREKDGYIEKLEKSGEWYALLAGTGVLAGVVLFGFAASFLLRPVFIVRYMVPAAGCFWLSFSCLVSRAVERKGRKGRIFYLVLLGILIIGIGDFRWFRNDETWRRVRFAEVEEAFSQIGPEDAVITQFNQVQGVTGYYLENDLYLWGMEPEELICDIFENKYFSVDSTEELKELLDERENVWFIGNKNADLLDEWKKEGIGAEEKQEFMLEVYWATLYRIYLE